LKKKFTRERKPNMSDKSKKIVGSVLLALVVGGMIYLTVAMWPWIMSLMQEEGREALKDRVSQMGFGGWLLLLGIQILQIIVAVLPGEPVEVIAGYLFGTWGGLFTCLLGILIGTVLVFLLVKVFKEKFITLFVSREKLESFRFLKNEARLESVTFILFLIPGTPKDVLTYAVALTRINPVRFFIIATLARIPSVITSTWAGASIMNENWALTIAIFAATAAIGLLGIWLNKRYTRRVQGDQAGE
jgi:uncharacterized membrane protein YdjX (TVP38/TMEM64 family)